MKILKRILIVIVILAGLILIVSLFLPRIAYVERSLVMKASPEVIFKQVNTLKNWEKWSPWFRLDPKMQLTYFGPESGAGAGYSWKSENSHVGTGKVTLSASVAGDSIISDLDFMKHGTATGGYKFVKEGDGTKVIWYFKSDAGMNPLAKIFGLMMDKMIGPDLEKGLHNLDSLSQAEMKRVSDQPKSKIYKIETGETEMMQVMTMRGSVANTDSIGFKLGSMYAAIGAAIKKQGLKQSGPVFAIYHEFKPGEKIDMEAGAPVDKKGKQDGKIMAKELPKCNTVYIDYYGPYDDMKSAHEQIQEFIKTSGKEMAGPPWEVYVSDPGTEKDPAKVLTKIYYPVK